MLIIVIMYNNNTSVRRTSAKANLEFESRLIRIRMNLKINSDFFVQNFHEDPISRFCVRLLTDRQTNAGSNITSSTEVNSNFTRSRLCWTISRVYRTETKRSRPTYVSWGRRASAAATRALSPTTTSLRASQAPGSREGSAAPRPPSTENAKRCRWSYSFTER